MMPLVGVFAVAAVAGAGAIVGWRLARDYLLPNIGARRAHGENSDEQSAKIIETEYMDVTDVPSSTANRRRRESG